MSPLGRDIVRIIAVLVIGTGVLLGLLIGAAHAATRPREWHTCERFNTRLIGGEEIHNDHFAGMPGRSCITFSHGRVTINTSYQRHGGSVVAYDAIQIGDYPFIRDPFGGLPAKVGRRMPVLHVSASSGPGTYLYDLDVWLGRGNSTGPLHYVRELIIANRWRGYGRYCDPIKVRVGTRNLPGPAGARVTAVSESSGAVMPAAAGDGRLYPLEMARAAVGRAGEPHQNLRFPPMRRVWVAHRLYHAGACETGSGSHRHLLIRFLAARQSAHATFPLAAFLKVACRHHWISKAMTVDSAGYAPEVWAGGRGLSYSMHVGGKP